MKSNTNGTGRSHGLDRINFAGQLGQFTQRHRSIRAPRTLLCVPWVHGQTRRIYRRIEIRLAGIQAERETATVQHPLLRPFRCDLRDSDPQFNDRQSTVPDQPRILGYLAFWLRRFSWLCSLVISSTTGVTALTTHAFFGPRMRCIIRQKRRRSTKTSVSSSAYSTKPLAPTIYPVPTKVHWACTTIGRPRYAVSWAMFSRQRLTYLL